MGPCVLPGWMGRGACDFSSHTASWDPAGVVSWKVPVVWAWARLEAVWGREQRKRKSQSLAGTGVWGSFPVVEWHIMSRKIWRSSQTFRRRCWRRLKRSSRIWGLVRWRRGSGRTKHGDVSEGLGRFYEVGGKAWKGSDALSQGPGRPKTELPVIKRRLKNWAEDGEVRYSWAGEQTGVEASEVLGEGKIVLRFKLDSSGQCLQILWFGLHSWKQDWFVCHHPHHAVLTTCIPLLGSHGFLHPTAACVGRNHYQLNASSSSSGDVDRELPPSLGLIHGSSNSSVTYRVHIDLNQTRSQAFLLKRCSLTFCYQHFAVSQHHRGRPFEDSPRHLS